MFYILIAGANHDAMTILPATALDRANPFNAPRIACVTLPHLAVALVERDDPEMVGRPFVVATGDHGADRVADTSYRAYLAGVAPGMTVDDARRLCPELAVHPLPADARRAAFAALLAALSGLSTAVEPADFDRAWFTVTGLAEGFDEERSLAAYAAVSARVAAGVPARVGLASGKATARIVTDYLQHRDTMVVPSGHESVFLSGLATRYLPLNGDAIHWLFRRGIRTVGRFAAESRERVRAALGVAGVRAHALAHGADDPRIVPWQRVAPIAAEHAFLAPVANRRSLAFRAARLALAVHGPLRARFRIAGALTLALVDPGGGVSEHRLDLMAPVPTSSDFAAWVDVLAQRAGGAPVASMTLSVTGLGVAPRWQLAEYARSLESDVDPPGEHGVGSRAEIATFTARHERRDPGREGVVGGRNVADDPRQAVEDYNAPRRIDPYIRIAT